MSPECSLSFRYQHHSVMNVSPSAFPLNQVFQTPSSGVVVSGKEYGLRNTPFSPVPFPLIIYVPVAVQNLANSPSHQNDPVCVHWHLFSPHQEQYVSRIMILQEALKIFQELRYPCQVLVREVCCCYAGPHDTAMNHISSRLIQP